MNKFLYTRYVFVSFTEQIKKIFLFGSRVNKEIIYLPSFVTDFAQDFFLFLLAHVAFIRITKRHLLRMYMQLLIAIVFQILTPSSDDSERQKG